MERKPILVSFRDAEWRYTLKCYNSSPLPTAIKRKLSSYPINLQNTKGPYSKEKTKKNLWAEFTEFMEQSLSVSGIHLHAEEVAIALFNQPR